MPHRSPAPFPDALRRRLEDSLGTDIVSFDDGVLAAYDHDETEDLRHRPDVVVRPTSGVEVAEAVRFAHRDRIPVTTRGAGTGLSGGALPVRGGIVLSLERLDRLQAIDPRDMVAEVEAGVITGDLMRAAEDHDLLYGPNPSSLDTCTLGGNLAENAAGPLSLRYGSTGAQVLGLEAVLADGSVVRLGGRNRKDVAGYDLARLLVGSEGTLGVITNATLRLHPAPRTRLSLLAAFRSLDDAARAVEVLCRRIPCLAACELVDDRAIDAVGRIEELPQSLREAGAALLLELHSDRDADPADLASEVWDELEPLGVDDLQVALDPTDERNLWRVRRQVAHGVRALSVYKEVDTVVPRSRLADLVRDARAVADDHGLTAISYGHAGDGNLHVNLLRGDLEPAEWAEARDRAESALFERVVALGGSLTGEHGIGWTQRRYLARHGDARAVATMRAIKNALDPHGILNPGKIFLDDANPSGHRS